jgi:hypothetical protein
MSEFNRRELKRFVDAKGVGVHQAKMSSFEKNVKKIV